MPRRSLRRPLVFAARLIAIAATAVTFRRHSLGHATTVSPAFLPTTTDPHAMLADADCLAWVFDSTKSAPPYARAEQMLAAAGDAADALHAKVGPMRATAETGSFPGHIGIFGTVTRLFISEV